VRLLQQRLDEADPGRSIPLRNGWVKKQLTEILAEAGQPMKVSDIRAELEEKLGRKLPDFAVKDCLSRNARGKSPRFKRLKRGWYEVRD
jgi:hypothetical protein